jgi:hypothetical protein
MVTDDADQLVAFQDGSVIELQAHPPGRSRADGEKESPQT